MSGLLHGWLPQAISAYGIWAVSLLVLLESMGMPLPGEAALVTAAIYAGATHRLDIALVIVAAATAATVGDNLGYWIGRRLGLPLVLRYGPRLGLTEQKVRLGQRLFAGHGGKLVFFGRFVALLRILTALLAGINRMRWSRFLVFNAAGAAVWATAVGGGAYLLGRQAAQMTQSLGLALLVLAVAAGIGSAWVVRRRLARFESAAAGTDSGFDPQTATGSAATRNSGVVRSIPATHSQV